MSAAYVASGMLVGGSQGLKRGGPTDSEVYQGPDGKDRYWIDDRRASIKPGIKQGHSYRPGEYKMGEVLHHPELFQRYPQLAGLTVKVHPVAAKTTENLAAYYIPSQNTFVINSGVMESHYRPENMDRMVIRSILHEVQHSIQQDEGTAFGSSPEQMREGLAALKEASPETHDQKMKLLEEYADSVLQRISDKRLADLSPAERQDLFGTVAYFLLYGEQEARAVEKMYDKRKTGRPDQHFDYDDALLNDEDSPYAGNPVNLKSGSYLLSPEGQQAVRMINQKLHQKYTPRAADIAEDPFAPTI